MTLWKNPVDRSHSDVHRLEDNQNIQYNIPAELFKIDAGQLVLFVSKDGFEQTTAQKINDLFSFLRYLDINDVKMNVVTTDNDEYLIGNIACRSPKEIGDTYKVAIGSWNTIAGLIAHYSGMSVDEVVKKVSSSAENSRLSINTSNLPVIVSINPEDCPASSQHADSTQFTCPFMGDDGDYGMGLKQVKPEKGSPAEKKFIFKQEKKLEKVLRECAIFDLSLDIDRIKKKVEDSLKSDVEYNLSLVIKVVKAARPFCPVCDIYVSKGTEFKLNLTAVEKAVYLSFLLYENGIRILDTADEFRRTTQKIYNQLPSADKCEKTAGGILDRGTVNIEVYTDTLRGYISSIRDEVADKISHPLVAQDFAIEGFKDKEFGIAKSTPEIRAQIKEAFGL